MQKVVLQLNQHEHYRTKEAFKTLRTNIEFCGDEISTIAITSCTPNEGKSSIAMNMARAFAEAGNSVALIDADLRKSVLVGRYKTGAVRLGLTHVLAGKSKLSEVLCETNVPNLYMIFAGPVPPNPSELLGSERFDRLMATLKEKMDYVIIDTPPLGSVIDAAVIARKVDGTAIVLESNAISYKFAQSVIGQLKKADAHILGVILNKVNMQTKGYYGHYGRYYGKYYGKYYGNYGSDVEAAAHMDTEPEAISDNAADKAGTTKESSKDTSTNTAQNKTKVPLVVSDDEIPNIDSLE